MLGKRSCRHLAVLGLALWAGGCSSLGAVFDRKADSSLEEVDGLLGGVERAHLECERSRIESLAALDALHAVVAPDFRGDAILAYKQLESALEISLKQAEALRATVDPMKHAAESIATEWGTDLEAFGSDVMRNKSRKRLAETTEAYLAVHEPLVAACDSFDLFNMGLSDHALYLGHDLNAAAVAGIEDELVVLTALQLDLESKLGTCMAAAGDYVRGKALRGQLDLPPVAAPTPEVAVGLRPGLGSANGPN